jgi:NitT/TauT family transport system substrate-binding protein
MIDRSRFLSVAGALAGVALVPGVAQAQAAPVAIRVGGSPNDDMTAVVYAARTGMYSRAGLEVTIEKANSGSAAAAAVAAGAFDIGKSSISSIFDAHVKGIPFTMIAPAAIYDTKSPYGGFLLSSSSTLRTGKDAEGQIVAVASLGSIGRVAFAGWVERNGGDPRLVKFVEVPIPAVPAALDAKRIVAGETSQPVQESAIAAGYRFLPAYDVIAPQFAVAVFYTTKDFSAKHPDALRTFVRVTYDAARAVNGHGDLTAKMMSEYTGVALDILQKTPRVALGTELVLSQVQSPIDAAVKYGVLAKRFPARDIVDANVTAR